MYVVIVVLNIFWLFLTFLIWSPCHFFPDCEKISVPNLEGVRQLILGSVYSNAGKLDVAKQSYIKAMKAGEATDDVHTSAFAAYELGMTLCRSPEVCIFPKLERFPAKCLVINLRVGN